MLPFPRMRRRQLIQRSAFFLGGLCLSACGFARSSTTQGVAVSSEGEGTTPGTLKGSTLNIYTWGSYVNPELNDKFSQDTSIKLVIDTYDNDELMLAKIQAGGGQGYSVVYPSNSLVPRMIKLGLLEKLDKSKLKADTEVIDRFKDSWYDPGNVYSLPVSWGTTGFAYNTKEVGGQPLTDWQDLWDRKEELKGRITLVDSARDVLGVGLKALGYSYNATDPKQIEEAYNKLRELKPYIAKFDSAAWRPQLVSGDLLVSMAYSGDGLSASNENPDIQYVLPASGMTVWADTVAIPKGAPNQEAAYTWINTILSPGVSAQMSADNLFGTAIKAAVPLVPEKLRNNLGWQPSDNALDKCEPAKPLDDTTQALYDKLYNQLKSL